MTSWRERVSAIGLSDAPADLAARCFEDVSARFAAVFGDSSAARAWWIPGRIEVLGKHTDYGGGRSLLCAVERGFHILAAPRPDQVVCLVDASTHASITIPLSGDAVSRPGHWTNYPITAVRRIVRDFPEARTGMNAVVRSSLPSASGLSSSSALIIACFLPLADINALAATSSWQAAFGHADALAEYLGALENGRAFGNFAADHGVGTQGGCEDQTAILRSTPGQLLQYHFRPVTPEASIGLPADWRFVVGVSGIHAAKGGAVQERYNALAQEIATLETLWRQTTGRDDRSLFAALNSSPDAPAQLARALDEGKPPRTPLLRARLAQFWEETDTLIPEVARRIAAGDLLGTGPYVARSQMLAEEVLRNQIPETVHLAQRATEMGATASSAFGAGFGGSVWALAEDTQAEAFRARWQADYAARFPERRARSEFFISRPGPSATAVP